MRDFVKLASLLALFAAPARAQDCTDAGYLTGVPLLPAYANAVMVPVAINGLPRMMLLDTAGVVTQLSRTTLNEFSLPERGSARRVFDVRGDVSHTATQVEKFSLGSIDFNSVKLQVSANPALGAPYAGLLSADILSAYDVDIDFGSSRLNLFSASNCGLQHVYWTTKPIAVVPFRISDSHITVPITLDGHALSAIVDTGAPFTILNRDIAEGIFGLTTDSNGVPLSLSADVNSSLAFPLHRFSRMTFEGMLVDNPMMLIEKQYQDPFAREPFWGSLPRRSRAPDVIIGMDILKTLHIYVAYKEHKLYITRADSEAGSLLPPVTLAPVMAALEP